MMEMKSTLMKRVWQVYEGDDDSMKQMVAGLIDILGLDPGAEVLNMIQETISLNGRTVLEFKSKDTQAVMAEVRIEPIEEEEDLFGDIVPAHARVTYFNLG